MRTLCLSALIPLSIVVPAAYAQDVSETGDAQRDAWIQQWENCDQARQEIETLIQDGELMAAENLVREYEPQFEDKWGMGRFGFGTRLSIAEAYLDRGDKQEALRLFRAAKPGGGCGNCMSSQHVQRNIRMARVYDSSLNFPASFLTYLDALPATGLGGGFFRILWGLVYSASATVSPVVVCWIAARWFRRRNSFASQGERV